MIHFVSGHLDVTQAEFDEHYAPRLNAAIQAGDAFIVGDARGLDSMAQMYLYGRTTKVTVFHMFETPRHARASFRTVGGFTSDRLRDRAMTAASDADIAWVRPGREKSGTNKNLKRRNNATP
jgi:hypothetical protein